MPTNNAKNMNIVIFSKDRACQLDGLYRSLRKNFKDIDKAEVSVIWTASTPFLESGYNLFASRFGKSVKMVKETAFLADLEGVVNSENQFTMFLVDDILFKRAWSLTDPEVLYLQNSELVLATSLRLWRGIDVCYATGQPSAIPSFTKKSVWQWNGQEGDWGYPMSVDGNIYRTKFIKEVMAAAPDYSNPNQFEAALSQVAPQLVTKTPYMVCYVTDSVLVNIPANRVQDEFKNKTIGSWTVEELNNRYLTDWIISSTTVEGQKNNTVHADIKYNWTKD